jgi:hypothetical protein
MFFFISIFYLIVIITLDQLFSHKNSLRLSLLILLNL